jgi:serine protease Do
MCLETERAPRPGRGSAGVGHWARGFLLLVLLAMAATPMAPLPLAAQSQAPREGFADLVERVAPAVVNISTSRAVRGRGQGTETPQSPQIPPGSPFEDFFREFFDRDRGPQQQTPRRSASLGSGFVIDAQGYVVTNNHVIADADEITVVFPDETTYPATLVGRDPKTDLAVLRIQAPGPFPAVGWADSDRVRVGDWMIAIGNPFGLGSTVTTGIISARGRDIRAGPYDDFFQVDAAINRGNSGGPSFTLAGEVFGVNTAIFSPSGGNVGIGFAIPSNLARSVVAALIRDGRVARGWLGVRIQTVTEEIAESLGLPQTAGALVASVTPGGPAERHGIEAGDVIISFDGKDITRMRTLPRIVAETAVETAVDVLLWRRGDRQRIQVVLGELPEDEELAALGPSDLPATPSTASVDELGLTIASLTGELRQRFELAEAAKGVVIVEVAPNGPASSENLMPGDLIVEVGQEEVHSPPEVMAKVLQAHAEDKRSVLLLIDRQGDLRFVALRFIRS